jgi:DNA-binding MarR family transcriptional regulator
MDPKDVQDMAAQLKDEDFRALANFRYQLRLFLNFSEKAARDVGLTPQQHQALLAIRGFGLDGLGVGELAERLLLRPHSASEIVDRLQRVGLIRRASMSQDRRQVRVVLTEEAETKLRRLSQIHRDELRKIGPLLNELLSAV